MRTGQRVGEVQRAKKTAQAETNVPNGLNPLCCFDVVSHDGEKNKQMFTQHKVISLSLIILVFPSSGLCRQPSVQDLRGTKQHHARRRVWLQRRGDGL